jgi:carbon-monoxide dehydrogenase catalytic subunit
VIVHGHEPNLFESMLVSVNDPMLVQAAKDAGAKGINLVGMCCSGAEMMSRHGIPHAGNFMSTEAGPGDRGRRCHVCGYPVHQAGAGGQGGRLLQTPLITTNPRATSKAPPYRV